MTRSHGLTRRLRPPVATALVAASLWLAVPETRAADVTGGQYTGSADLGPVLLDGRYPFHVGENAPGSIDVTMSPTGALDARVSLFGATEPATGQVTVRKGVVRLSLRGKVDEGRIRIAATLQGSAFVGTIALGGRTAPCRIEVAVAGPVHVQYRLDLTCSANGAITGTGTLGAGSQEVAVTVRGTVRRQRVALTIAGGGTLLRLTEGAIGAGSVTAKKWSARAFGATVRGTRRFSLSRD